MEIASTRSRPAKSVVTKLLISRPLSRILHKRSSNNQENKKHYYFPCRSAAFTFLCKTNNTRANQWADWACICATSLDVLGDVFVETNLMSSAASSLFLDFGFIEDKGWKSSLTEVRETNRSRQGKVRMGLSMTAAQLTRNALGIFQRTSNVRKNHFTVTKTHLAVRQGLSR